jgi:uncharacterized protein
MAAGLALPGSGLAAPSPAETSLLRYGTLGRTRLEVTKFVFGSMITSDTSVIERAVDLGLNCFLSARDYQSGNNERLLASGLGANRKKLILGTSTIDMMWRKNEKEDLKYALATLDTSLRELKTDYVDLWFFHQKNSPEAIGGYVPEAIRIAKQQGKIRFGGVTTHRLSSISGPLTRQSEIDVVIPIYNFTMGPEMHRAVEEVHAAGLGVIAMKVMAGGLRTDKPVPQMKREGAIQAALKWALNHPHLDAAVSSMSDADQLEENVRAMSAPYTDSDRTLLASALHDYGSDYCRSCGGCAGQCAQGLPVPDLIRYASYADGYGHFALGRERYVSLPLAIQTASCSDCSSCTVACRNGVHVRSRVSRAQSLFG